jgi:hypothetical protein
LLGADLANAGVALERYWALASQMSLEFFAAEFVVYAAILTGVETVAGVPEWRTPLRLAREFARKAHARWWLEQLPA